MSERLALRFSGGGPLAGMTRVIADMEWPPPDHIDGAKEDATGFAVLVADGPPDYPRYEKLSQSTVGDHVAPDKLADLLKFVTRGAEYVWREGPADG